jgi:hypothetical protein
MSTFRYSIGPGDTRITFPEKPSEAIRALLKGAGFRWSPAAGCWWRRGVQGAANFLAALDRKMSPRRPDGACWRCRAPEGYFRPRGAAAPVYCDSCHAALNAPQQPDRFDLDYEDRCRAACGL